MYRDLRVAVAIPAYNEEKLISRTVETMPDFVDCIIVTNDGSKDSTLEVLHALADDDKRLVVLDNERNRGVGYSVVRGLKEALNRNMDLIAVMAADAQCDPAYLAQMCDVLIDERLDYVKANRYQNLEALRKMPTYRRIGNVVVTIMNKFSTGYYSIFDSQNGYGVFSRTVLERLPFELVGERYDYENTLLLAMSVVNGRIKDHPVPAIYGDETTSIKFLPTVWRAVSVLFVGFWRRIYYKYIVFDFHPVALFLIAGLLLTLAGSAFGLVLTGLRIFGGDTPTSGTVMLAVLPLLTGFQLLLTALIIDINNENKP
jgi:glycosyltransferase involved in cell wall biosynthesis